LLILGVEGINQGTYVVGSKLFSNPF